MNDLDAHLLAKMRRLNHISWQIYAWVFFKSKFLGSCQTNKAAARHVCSHMEQMRAENEQYHSLSDEEKDLVDIEVFRQYIRHRWPVATYPAAVRPSPASRLGFENKLYHYWDSLLGPDRKIKAKQSRLIPGQLGLFSACDNLTIPRDVKYIWGDLHPVNCTNEQWVQYHIQYSCCFQSESQMIRKFLYSGPASLANHHCTKSQLSVASGDSLTVSGSRQFKRGEEIYFHYGQHYFTKENPCICCSKHLE